VLIALTSAEEVPEKLLEGLSSEQFKQREASQVELQKWVDQNGQAAITSIYRVYIGSDDPEIRSRCLRLLRTQSDKDYLNDGKGYLGVQLAEEMLEIVGDDKPRICLKITYVMPGSQAELAGIKAGDIIASMDGEKWYEVGAVQKLINTVASYKPLRRVVFEIKRPGEVALIEVPVILGKRPVDDLGAMYYGDISQLEKEAKDKHFDEWLKKQKTE
jgi:predicted metalloprotease with PDZ domain